MRVCILCVILALIMASLSIRAVFSGTCAETKPAKTQCGNSGDRNEACVMISCGIHTTKETCDGQIEVVECEKSVQINETSNSPEQTKTGTDTVAALVNCFYYYDCVWGSITKTCKAKTTKITHKVSPVKIMNCP